MKKIVLKDVSEIQDYIEDIAHSAEQAQLRITEISEETNALSLMQRLKFERLGYDPLNSSRDLNFIEQLNQTFTYLASLKAAEFIFDRHPSISSLTLNLAQRLGQILKRLIVEVLPQRCSLPHTQTAIANSKKI